MPSLETDRGEDALLTTTAGLLVEQLKMIFWHNRSVGDTSMKFGMNILCKSLFSEKSAGHQKFQYGGHFFQDGRQHTKNCHKRPFFFKLLPLKRTANAGVAKRISSVHLGDRKLRN